jgi:hypothetical protein
MRSEKYCAFEVCSIDNAGIFKVITVTQLEDQRFYSVESSLICLVEKETHRELTMNLLSDKVYCIIKCLAARRRCLIEI